MTEQVNPADPDDGAERSERVERHWAAVATALMALLVVMAVFAGVHQATLPQSHVETADPRTLHLHGEFIESNLGSALEPDGSVTVRAIGQQYSFTPQCILVPTDTPITFRVTSADMVHGFLITGTAINLMLVPGYISSFRRVSISREIGICRARNSAAWATRGCGAGSKSSIRRHSSAWLPTQGG